MIRATPQGHTRSAGRLRVSIVVCNYNYAPFLDGAIRSAVEQDYPDTEVIVVDDGSTDGSQEIIASWGSAVRVVSKTNGGQISACNAGFELVTGDLVIFLDSDDALDRGACARIVAAFETDTVKVHYRLRLVDPEGVPLGPKIPDRMADGDLVDRLRVHGELYPSAPGSGNAYRVSALRRLMPLPADEGDRHGADFFALYGISLLGKVRVAAEEPLGSYRVHRRSAEVALSFGNALRDAKEPHRTYRRYARLQRWVSERLGPEYVLPPVAPDFSLEKQGYAAAIFATGSYVKGLEAGSPLLMSNVLPSIRRMKAPWPKRAGFAFWAVVVLVLPRRAGLPLARYVCNPASR
jgi:glycosyltransferase involved in cell wall biosynthesis